MSADGSGDRIRHPDFPWRFPAAISLNTTDLLMASFCDQRKSIPTEDMFLNIRQLIIGKRQFMCKQGVIALISAL